MNDTMEKRIARFRTEVQTISNRLVVDLQEARLEDLKVRGLTSTPDQIRDDTFKCGKAAGEANLAFEMKDYLIKAAQAASKHGNVVGVTAPQCIGEELRAAVLGLHNASYNKGEERGYERGRAEGINQGRKESLEYDIDRVMDALNKYIRGCIRVEKGVLSRSVWPAVLDKYSATHGLINELVKTVRKTARLSPIPREDREPVQTEPVPAPDHTRTPAGMIVQALRLLLEELKAEGE